MLGDKTAADVQSAVTIEGNTVKGTSKYIADWSSQGFDPTKGTNFVAIHAKAPTGASIVAQAVPTQGTPTPSFNDDDVVFQITPNTKAVEFTVSKDGASQKTALLLDLELKGA